MNALYGSLKGKYLFQYLFYYLLGGMISHHIHLDEAKWMVTAILVYHRNTHFRSR